MNKNIFVNLPIKNLEKTKEFFSTLGYTFNPQFTDEKAACMVISENIFAMLITEEFFKTFTTREIADTSNTTEVLIALSAESREEVDELVDKAIVAGGKEHKLTSDHGFMYARNFEDLDGHIWEVLWMDPGYIQK